MVKRIEGLSIDPLSGDPPWQIDLIDAVEAGERPVHISLAKHGRLAYIDVYGDALWQHHELWMAPAEGIEIWRFPGAGSMGDGWYRCAPLPEGASAAEEPQQNQKYYAICNEKGGVVGYRVGLRLTPQVSPGLYTLYLDDEPIPFVLEAEGRKRPLQLAFKSCSILEEVDGPDPGLTLFRASPMN